MLTKLNAMREAREEGFTLIELLVVILIIGILAAIAIPVFLNQRKTSNDAAVESDVKNAATAVETWTVSQTGNNVPIDYAALVAEYGLKTSEGVTLSISGTNSGGYCILGYHENGKNYISNSIAATYDSLAGGLNKDGAYCAGGASNENGESTGPITTVAQVSNGTSNDDVDISAAWVGSNTEFTITGSDFDGQVQAEIQFFCDGAVLGYPDSFAAYLSGGSGSGSPMWTPTDCAGVLTASVTTPDYMMGYDPLHFVGTSTVTISGSPATNAPSEGGSEAPTEYATTSIAGSGTLTGSVYQMNMDTWESVDSGYTWSLDYTVAEDNSITYTFTTNAPEAEGSQGTITLSDGQYGSAYGFMIDFPAISGGTSTGSFNPGHAVNGGAVAFDPMGMNSIHNGGLELRQ